MKRYALITILLVLTLCLFSGAFVVAKADGETEEPVLAPTVYANDVQTISGNCVYVYVYAKDFVNVSGIDLYLYFDKDVFTYNYHYVSDFLSSAVSDFNTNVVGQITTSSVTVNGLNGDGLLFYVCLDVKSGAKAGAYNFGVAVGDCYDTALSPVTVNAIGAKITVSDPPVNLETVYFYSNVSSVSAKIGDTVTASFVTYDSHSFASADFEVEYDKSLLKVESVTLSQTLRNLNGAIYSVNTSTEGYVKTSFVALEGAPSYVYDAITVTFTVIADVTKNSEIKFTASGLSNSDFTPFLGTTAQMALSLTEVPKTPVYPKVYVKATTTSARDFTVDLVAESNTKIAAGDFLVGFDAQYFSCIKIESVTDGCMVVGNPAFQAGVARLSFIYEDGVSAETVIARLSFKTTASCGSVANFTLQGKNVTDKDYNPLTLDYISGKITIEHAFSDTFTVDLYPKCLTDGSKSRHCSYCTVSCDVTKIDALGHDPVHHDGQAADCENNGWEDYDTCSRCDYTSFKEIPALGHKEGTAVVESRIPATCLNGGTYNSVVYCTVCGDKLSSAPKTEDALGHDPVHHDGQAADCENKGWEDYDTCSRCDYTSFKEIPALGHKEGTAVVESRIPATCLNGGTYNSVVYCTVCGDKLSSTPKTEDALGHDPVHHDGRAADCENKGWEDYDTCSRCDYTSFKEIPALGHKDGTAVKEDYIPATCLNGGTYNSVVYCTVCGDKLSSTPKTEDALEHDYVSVEVTEPTCTTDGLISKKQCENCGEEVDVKEVLPRLGHDWDSWVVVKEATSTEKGLKERVCSRCELKETLEIPVINQENTQSGGCSGCGSGNMAELFSTALLSLAALFFKKH